ncbi:MAG: hypothetical protein KKB50_19425 [Planctomycetes bacterium]|nr:hypothetical protein [Planctomycetota bacterium]
MADKSPRIWECAVCGYRCDDSQETLALEELRDGRECPALRRRPVIDTTAP